MTDARNSTDGESGNAGAGQPEQGSGEKTSEKGPSCCSGSMKDQMMEMMGKTGGMRKMMSMCREMMQEMGAGCDPSGSKGKDTGESST